MTLCQISICVKLRVVFALESSRFCCVKLELVLADQRCQYLVSNMLRVGTWVLGKIRFSLVYLA